MPSVELQSYILCKFWIRTLRSRTTRTSTMWSASYMKDIKLERWKLRSRTQTEDNKSWFFDMIKVPWLRSSQEYIYLGNWFLCSIKICEYPNFVCFLLGRKFSLQLWPLIFCMIWPEPRFQSKYLPMMCHERLRFWYDYYGILATSKQIYMWGEAATRLKLYFSISTSQHNKMSDEKTNIS